MTIHTFLQLPVMEYTTEVALLLGGTIACVAPQSMLKKDAKPLGEKTKITVCLIGAFVAVGNLVLLLENLRKAS